MPVIRWLKENRLGGNSLYILDEPESALLPARTMRPMCNIDRLIKRNSKLIISTHSPILMTFLDADIYEITSDGISLVTYDQTEHYQVTKQFFNNPDRIHRILFEEEENQLYNIKNSGISATLIFAPSTNEKQQNHKCNYGNVEHYML